MPFVAFFIFLFLFPFNLEARTKRYTLTEFIETAEKTGAALGQQKARLQFAEARAQFARSKGWVDGSLTALVAPVPGASGNAVNGSTDWDRWGLLSSLKIEVFQPLYTFGAIDKAKKAANAGIDAEKALYDSEKFKLHTEIAELYYGYQMAFEFIALTTEAEKRLESVLKNIKSPSQRDQLASVLNEIKIRKAEAEMGRENARKAMAWKIGMPDERLNWDRANLILRKIQIKPFDEYLKISKVRPDRRALQKAVVAKRAMYESTKAQRLPAIIAGAQGEFSYAPHRDNQLSPFANDLGNRLEGAVGIGLRLDLGIPEKNAEAAKARAEMVEAEARLRHLDSGINVELFKAYNDLVFAQKSAELRSESFKAAKRLIQDYAIDTELKSSKSQQGAIQKFASYLSAKRDEIKAIHEFNIQVFKFEQAVGKSVF